MSRRQLAQFVTCRTLGHSWDIIASDGRGAYGGDPLWLRCTRCYTQRHDSISLSTGELMVRRYLYVDGYQHAFDEVFVETSPTRSDFRKMLLAEHLNRKKGDAEARVVSSLQQRAGNK